MSQSCIQQPNVIIVGDNKPTTKVDDIACISNLPVRYRLVKCKDNELLLQGEFICKNEHKSWSVWETIPTEIME